MHARPRVENDALRPDFVTRRPGDGVLEQVGEGPVPHVVQERRSQRITRPAGRDLLPERQVVMNGAKPCEEQLHDERGAERVRESGVLGPGEGHGSDAELSNATEPLELGRRQEQLDDVLLLGLEGDEAVDGVSQDHAGRSISGAVSEEIAPSSA
jgi:hypothetical protein